MESGESGIQGRPSAVEGSLSQAGLQETLFQKKMLEMREGERVGERGREESREGRRG